MPGLFDAHAHGSQGVNQIIPQQTTAAELCQSGAGRDHYP